MATTTGGMFVARQQTPAEQKARRQGGRVGRTGSIGTA